MNNLSNFFATQYSNLKRHDRKESGVTDNYSFFEEMLAADPTELKFLRKNFFTAYRSWSDFGKTLVLSVGLPAGYVLSVIENGLMILLKAAEIVAHLLEAAWQLITFRGRAAGNSLLDIGSDVVDIGKHALISVGRTAMAALTLVAGVLEIFTRIGASLVSPCLPNRTHVDTLMEEISSNRPLT
ncbi:hypothetical protein ACFORL_12600 [Legionella dresdenensis]|uniref:Uncharacterized protein n=1 Tax=Legionella dresdenensis TaxID=450200 RepID=A0ABV8CIV2_9GAMM